MNISKLAAVLSFALGAWFPIVSPVSADFLHIATTVSGNSTYLNSPYLNNNPTRLLTVTPMWNPAGGATGVYNNHPIGVWYDTSRGRWAIFNQDGDMPVGAAFYVNDGNPSSNFIVQRATSATVSGNSLYIDNPGSNGNPKAIIYATANWNPGGVGGVFNPHSTGVWYDTARGKWAVFNQDGQPMPAGAAFNVLIMQSGIGTCQVVHRATTTNIVMNSTYLSSSTLPPPNGIGWWWLTANWNPYGVGGVFNNHPIGVWYDSLRRQWAIFNQDRAPMPVGAAFNICVQGIPG